ncbi:lantibiotic immunity ABC transporter MutE/EpiE family permease subunit [Thermoanaerobacterium sp. DL9XJH110]|uniref:lantibiotic immunity ABC transporter MutE/EpiE family permease subunit n=1 Tax=Thermoanaerobacterium sp. DL9XJH110 TaxID=3386643 RepID=UPI003BB637F8
MTGIIQSEYLKYKKTFARRLIIFGPLFFILLALLQKLFIPEDFIKTWQLLLGQVYNWWSVLFIPMGTALFAALVQVQEERAGNYRNLHTRDISLPGLWAARVLVMAAHTGLATLVLIASTVISGLITADGNIPWFKITAGGLAMWVSSMDLIPLQLWVAAKKGAFASMAVGFLGLAAGVMAAPESYWIFVPWSRPTRLMCPIIGVHPNGVLLEPGDPLLNPSVILPGIAAAIVSFTIFTALTAIWFNRREVW